MTAALLLALGIAACAAPAGALVGPDRRTAARLGLMAVALVVGAALCFHLDIGLLPALLLLAVPVAWGSWAALAGGPGHALGRWLMGLSALGLCAALGEPAAQRIAAPAAAAGVLLLLSGPANEAVTALLLLARGSRGARAPVADSGRGGSLGAGAGVEAAAGVPAWARGGAHGSGSAGGGALLGPAAMRGGRWIGPLERILILLLVSTGANEAVAAVVAAKGVIRFPEISKDEGGQKAEEFLVGSLASWALAAIGVALIRSA